MKAAIAIAVLVGLAACVADNGSQNRKITTASVRLPLQTALDVQAKRRMILFDAITSPTAGSKDNASQLPSMAGREDLDPEGLRTVGPVCAALPGDPLETIAVRARKTNIVIINEDHSSPRHRWFVSEVLKRLRSEGYSIYAGESFAYSQISLDNNLADSGYYTWEPVYGRTLAVARSMGYRLVAYEQRPEQRITSLPEDFVSATRETRRKLIDEREQAQTDNLMVAIFRDDPDAKAIIHVGVAHVNEELIAAQGPVPWMAARLKMATGRDPLTISQTRCLSGGEGIVVSESIASGGGQDQAVDLFIGHPELTFTNGRPSWRTAAGDKPVPVPCAASTERVLVEARRIEQGADETPIDRLFLFPGEALPLLLPLGRYRVECFLPVGPVGSATVLDVR